MKRNVCGVSAAFFTFSVWTAHSFIPTQQPPWRYLVLSCKLAMRSLWDKRTKCKGPPNKMLLIYAGCMPKDLISQQWNTWKLYARLVQLWRKLNRTETWDCTGLYWTKTNQSETSVYSCAFLTLGLVFITSLFLTFFYAVVSALLFRFSGIAWNVNIFSLPLPTGELAYGTRGD